MMQMAKVRLFGIYSLKATQDEYDIEADDIEEVLLKLSKMEPNLNTGELKKSLIFVNGKSITELNMYRTKVNSGDNISILSPIAGG